MNHVEEAAELRKIDRILKELCRILKVKEDKLLEKVEELNGKTK
jgi:hypothetical protein